MNTTTDTPDTTRLSEARINQINATVDAYMRDRTTLAASWSAAVIVQLTSHITTLSADLARVTAENARLRQALDTVIAEAGAIWDDDNPVHPAHGSRLDTMLFAAKTAIAAPSAADRDHDGEGATTSTAEGVAMAVIRNLWTFWQDGCRGLAARFEAVASEHDAWAEQLPDDNLIGAWRTAAAAANRLFAEVWYAWAGGRGTE